MTLHHLEQRLLNWARCLLDEEKLKSDTKTEGFSFDPPVEFKASAFSGIDLTEAR